MIRPDTSLWAFSVSFYQHPKVEPLCLRLQDQFGVNVNGLLWALWLDLIYPQSDMSVWQCGISKAALWHGYVVVPLRYLRRRIPKTVGWSRIRGCFLRVELRAEKRELRILERVAVTKSTAQGQLTVDTPRRFLPRALEGLPDEQAQVAELFEQWFRENTAEFSADEKKPL